MSYRTEARFGTCAVAARRSLLAGTRAVKRKRKQRKLPPLSRSTDEALSRAARRAREIARQYGTPIYVSRNGKVVAIKP